MEFRDHRKEHEGCDAVFPWLNSCSRWKSRRKMVEMCLEDIKDMDKDLFDKLYQVKRDHHAVAKSRYSARDKYISIVEGWNEEEQSIARDMAEWRFEHGNMFFGKTVEEDVEHVLKRERQSQALSVIYAYGMFNKKTGKIELDRLNKLT